MIDRTTLFFFTSLLLAGSSVSAEMPMTAGPETPNVFVDHKGELILAPPIHPGNADHNRDDVRTKSTIQSVSNVDDFYMVRETSGRRDQAAVTTVSKVQAMVLGKEGRPIAFAVKSDSGLELVDAKSGGSTKPTFVGSLNLIKHLREKTTGKLDVARSLLSGASPQEEKLIQQIQELSKSRHDYARTTIAAWKRDAAAPGKNGAKDSVRRTPAINGAIYRAQTIDSAPSVSEASEKAASEVIREH